jgi:hypothetical protein
VLASAGLAWLARRLDALALAVTAVPTTLVVNRLLKELLHRQPPDGPLLLFPSGSPPRRPGPGAPSPGWPQGSWPPWAPLAWLASGFLAALGAARLAGLRVPGRPGRRSPGRDVHYYLTDVLAGAATGLVVTLAIALAITARWRTGRARVTRPGAIDPLGGDLTDRTRT